MARREAAVQGMNLDSLMDTLTNVVGILLIILIFTVLSGIEAMKRIRGFVDEISDRQFSQVTTEVESLRKLLEEQRKLWEKLKDETPKMETSIAQSKELIEQLKADLAKLDAAKVDVNKLKKLLEERRERVKKLEQDIATREKEIASLQARLASIPLPGPDPDAKVVSLPDPRDAPKGAKRVVFICRGGLIAPVDIEALKYQTKQLLRRMSTSLVQDNKLDCQRLTETLEKRMIGDHLCRVKVSGIGGDGKPSFIVDIWPGAGDKAESISKPGSRFHQWARRINPSQYYVEFRVRSDSFETYLEARNILDKKGVLAGWVPCPPDDKFLFSLGSDLKMTCLGWKPPPPPPKSTKPPPPPGPKRPPPPPDVVD